MTPNSLITEPLSLLILISLHFLILLLGFPDSSVGKESTCNAGKPWFNAWVGKIHWRRRDRLLTPVLLGFPGGSAGKEFACNAGDLGSIPGLRRSLGEGNSYPLQHSGLESSMDCIAHGVTKSQTRLSNFHLGFPHSSVGKESACNAGDPGLIPGLGRSPGVGNSSPLQYCCLENPKGRGTWRAMVHGVARVRHHLATKPPILINLHFLKCYSKG